MYVRRDQKNTQNQIWKAFKKMKMAGLASKQDQNPPLPTVGVHQRQSWSTSELRLIAKTFFHRKTLYTSKAFLAFKHHNTKQASFEICHQSCNNSSVPLTQVQALAVI